MAIPTLDTGDYYVSAPCPRCGVVEEILASIRSHVGIPQDAMGKLTVKLKAKGRDHDCHQRRIGVDSPLDEGTS